MHIKIAYMLLVHKSYKQVNIFIRQLLDYGECDVYLHVDSKSKGIIDKIIKDDRVKIYSKYDVRWGSFEIVQAGIFLMEKVLESGNNYSHIYWGTGQDLLVKKGLYQFLMKNPEKIFIRINRELKDTDRAAARYLIQWPKYLMVRSDYHIFRFIRITMQILCKLGINIRPNRRTYKSQLRFYEGRTWFICPKAVVEYMIDYIHKNMDFVNYWENSLASDLMFFQTIMMNSQFSDKIQDELMYVRFGKSFGTINHPVTITKKNSKDIETGNYYCARKFELDEDADIITYFCKVTKNV